MSVGEHDPIAGYPFTDTPLLGIDGKQSPKNYKIYYWNSIQMMFITSHSHESGVPSRVRVTGAARGDEQYGIGTLEKHSSGPAGLH